MQRPILAAILLLFGFLILSAGCTEPPVKEPVVTVTDISLSEISLRTMTVNTTVRIHNPNPIGAELSKVTFSVYYRDGSDTYIGHGEKTGIEVKESGNTTVVIPVTMENVPAVTAVGSFIRKGSITILVNGSAFIDVKVTSFEKKFSQSRTFRYEDFRDRLPLSSIEETTGINVSERLQQAKGFLDTVAGYRS